MTDIVDTLRQRYRFDPIIQDAADEIENLRSDVDFFIHLLGLLPNDNPTDANDTNGHPEGFRESALCD
jgi:hypothetical protein